MKPLFQAQELRETLQPPEDQPDTVLMHDPVTKVEKIRLFSNIYRTVGIVLLLLFMPVLGHFTMTIYDQTETSLAPFFFCIILYRVACILQNAVFYFKINKQAVMGRTYMISSIFLLAKVVTNLGFYLYATDRLPEGTIKYFVYPEIAILVAYFRYSSGYSLMYVLFQCVSMYIIAGFIEENPFYYFVTDFLVYYLLLLAMTIVVIVIWAVFFFFLSVNMTRSERLNTLFRDFPHLSHQYPKILAIYFGMSCLLTYHIYLFFMYIWGVQQFIAQGYLRLKQQTADCLPQSLAIAGHGFVVIGYLDILICIFLLIVFKDKIQVWFEKLNGREITFQSLRDSVQLNLQKISENYFKESSPIFESLIMMRDTEYIPKEEKSFDDTIQEIGECQICMAFPATSWFEPCGHTIVCQHCIGDFLKKYDKCMLCRSKICKVHLIYRDPATQAFKSKGAYNLGH